MKNTAPHQCPRHPWGAAEGLACTRSDPHEPGHGCIFETGSHVDDRHRPDGGHG